MVENYDMILGVFYFGGVAGLNVTGVSKYKINWIELWRCTILQCMSAGLDSSFREVYIQGV